MTAVYIICGVLLFILILLIVPVSIDIDYRDKLFVKVRYAGIKFFDSDKQKDKKKPEDKKTAKAEHKVSGKKKEGYIARLFREKGKIEGIKFCFALAKAVISRAVFVIKRIRFRELLIDISVASDDAANTAISYGAVCAAVYPTVNLLDQKTSLTVKKVNVYTDFDKLSPEIEAAVLLKTRLIYALIASVSLFFAYLRLKKESDKNGRK